MATRRSGSEPSQRRRKPATTPEARENELIALAQDVAERQMREGTASSQVITSFLKLGTTRERLEQQRLKYEVELLQTKREHLESLGRTEDLHKEAIKAMRSYQGVEDPDDDEPYY